MLHHNPLTNWITLRQGSTLPAAFSISLEQWVETLTKSGPRSCPGGHFPSHVQSQACRGGILCKVCQHCPPSILMLRIRAGPVMGKRHRLPPALPPSRWPTDGGLSSPYLTLTGPKTARGCLSKAEGKMHVSQEGLWHRPGRHRGLF